MDEDHNYQRIANRLCIGCKRPLDNNEHGNKKSHSDCAKNYKKQHQKEKYQIGNTAKLMIQKNEAIAESLYKMDQQKLGIPYLAVLAHGFNFNCPSAKRRYLNRELHMLDRYGYSFEIKSGETLILIYHDSELQ